MSELVQEALKSEDVEKLKNVRIVEKNAFTRFDNRLKKLLVTESDKVTFKLEEINYEEVVDAFGSVLFKDFGPPTPPSEKCAKFKYV